MQDASHAPQQPISRGQAIQAIRLTIESRELPDVTPLHQSRTIAKIILESEFADIKHLPGSREYNELVNRLSLWAEQGLDKKKAKRKKRV